jgi:hypothetical protein
MMTDSQSSLIRGAVSLALQDDARGEAVSMADMTFSCVSAQRHEVGLAVAPRLAFPQRARPWWYFLFSSNGLL